MVPKYILGGDLKLVCILPGLFCVNMFHSHLSRLGFYQSTLTCSQSKSEWGQIFEIGGSK